MQIVDLNYVNNGEVASPLHRLLQEINMIIVSDGQLITMPGKQLDLDSYLFKYGLSENQVATKVQNLIDENVMNPEGYRIEVEVAFLKGLVNKDTMLINVVVYLGQEEKYRLTYSVKP